MSQKDYRECLSWELELPIEMVESALDAQNLYVVTDADMKVLQAAKDWYRLDTSVNSERLHYYIEKLIQKEKL